MIGGGARAALASAVLALTAVLGLPVAPALAESCSGVTAVVDFGALGGGVQERCVADGAGRPAWDVFEEAGFPLTPVQQYPDAVCRVSGKPAGDPCYRMPPANAYWGLFWSNGSGWVYSSKGARSLTVPAGGSVGFAWQSSTAQRAPGASPASPQPSPTPTKKATAKASPKPTATPRAAVTSATPSERAPSSASATPSVSASASASATAVAPLAPVTTGTPTPSAAPSTATAAGPVESRDTAADTGGGLPWFVPAGVLVLLAAGGAGATWWRRRASG